MHDIPYFVYWSAQGLVWLLFIAACTTVVTNKLAEVCGLLKEIIILLNRDEEGSYEDYES